MYIGKGIGAKAQQALKLQQEQNKQERKRNRKKVKFIMEGKSIMKKARILLIMLVCAVLTGCGNEFARLEYNSADKIAQEKDRYAKVSSVFNPIDGGYSLKAAQFDGRETMWSSTIEEEKDIELQIQMSLSEGTAKVVHIDEDGNVTTVLECTSESTTNGYITQTISLKSGRNRIKVVGKDCKDLDLELLSSDF